MISPDEEWLLAQFPDDFLGYAVELGAFDGVYGSNTLEMERRGWTVLCIEANPSFRDRLAKSRLHTWSGACSDYQGKSTFHILDPAPACYSSLSPQKHRTREISTNDNLPWSEVQVEVDSLDHQLELRKFPRLDAAVIDTEGTELDVLKGLDLARWQPKALVIESWDTNSPVVSYLGERGYPRVERRGVNDLFVRAQ